MKYRLLGNSGLRVSEAALGTANAAGNQRKNIDAGCGSEPQAAASRLH
jgi:aryl-alcohol dehydrogenase-like predicted oxidoreductase